MEGRRPTVASLNGMVAAAQAVERYNAIVDEYNRRCAGRPFNPDLWAQISAHPNCPPFR